MLTFELIRELQMREKENKQLQELPPNFYEELKQYLEAKEGDELARSAALDLVERRIRKILTLLPSCVRTGVEPANLSPEERWIFQEMKRVIEKYLTLSFETQKEEKSEPKQKKIRITRKLKPFVWRDLKVYELKEGEILADLPDDLKDFLLKHGCGEVVE